MRHGKKFNHLAALRLTARQCCRIWPARLSSTKRINTTLAKARELRKYVEPLISKSKKDDTHSRRMVFTYLNSKEAVKELFGEIAAKVANRPGGYTRIIKLGNRLGDAAEMCMIELVDFNTIYSANTKAEAAAKKPRTRRAGSKKKAEEAAAAPVAEDAKVPEAEAQAPEEKPAE